MARLALNHGNPASRGKLFEAPDENAPEDLKRTYRDTNRELQTDYDLAQAFRDDPRGITQACSLIFALLDRDAGPLCVSLAVIVYEDVLLRFANETFTWKTNKDDYPQLEDLFLAKAEDRTLPTEPELVTGLKQELFQITYSGLFATLERFRFPILNRLNGLKILADAMILQSGGVNGDGQNSKEEDLMGEAAFTKTFGGYRHSHLGRLVRELQATSEVYDSDMHFPSHKLGMTQALAFQYMRQHGLHAIYDDKIRAAPDENNGFYSGEIATYENPQGKPTLSDTIFTRESVGESAITRLNRSQESFSMGQSYYENIGYLNYLNDDFNDRSIHFNHASSMALADLTEFMALVVKEGFKL